uniref:Uncharacterized protein n=1 Tax=Romanomermis culicivorax TaxID=13658 RepID=A0A915KI38_ROMCU
MAYKRKNDEQLTDLATKFAKVGENLMATESMRSLNKTMEKRMEMVENRVQHLDRVGPKRIAWLYNFPFDLYPMDVKYSLEEGATKKEGTLRRGKGNTGKMMNVRMIADVKAELSA